jgi:16S rRNA (guanine1207-N2)-methyltransferase
VTATEHGADLSLAAQVDAPRETYDFETATGVCSPDEFRGAELALVEELWVREVGRLLVVETNYGVPGVLLAEASQGVAMTESSARGASYCEANAERNGVGDAVVVANVASPRDLDVSTSGEGGGQFDTAAYAPKPYTPLSVAKERLVAALECLPPGGRLFVAARERTGFPRFADALDSVVASVETVGEHGACSVLAATRPEQFDAPSFVEPREFSATVDGVTLSLVSVPGVFSATGLDHGTRLLLQTADVVDGDRVLDLCCGYGTAGVWAAKASECSVTLTDDDRVATRCAECSLAASGVEGEVLTADGTAGVEGEGFDTVLCNPPTHAGDDVLRDLFDGARRVLSRGGTLWVVHHRALDLRAQLSGFERVDCVAQGDEHVVLEVVA